MLPERVPLLFCIDNKGAADSVRTSTERGSYTSPRKVLDSVRGAFILSKASSGCWVFAIPLEQLIPRVFQFLHHFANGPVQTGGHQFLLFVGQRGELFAQVAIDHVLQGKRKSITESCR